MTNDELDSILHASSYPEVFDALSYVGAHSLVEFEPRVRALLSDSEETIRAFAVEVLSSDWLLASFRTDCETIATNDPATWVRRAAWSGLIAYGNRAGDVSVAGLLWNLLKDPTRPTQERALAIDGLPLVLEGDAAATYFHEAGDYARNSPMGEDDFAKLVPWDTMRSLVTRHAVAV